MWYVVPKVYYENHLYGIGHLNHPQNISLMDIILNAMQTLPLAWGIFLQASSAYSIAYNQQQNEALRLVHLFSRIANLNTIAYTHSSCM